MPCWYMYMYKTVRPVRIGGEPDVCFTASSRLEGVLVSRPAGWLGGATPAGPQVSVPEVERWSGGMDGMSAGQKRQRGSRSVDIFEFSAESQVGEGTYG